ncbi:uncharacterized protein [Heterodontus francisci]|uniref:uncharacterized protein isoform X2 n=1 Tax=Heterodontus francisci TaxID=7792 RepID=UPI00355BB8ED
MWGLVGHTRAKEKESEGKPTNPQHTSSLRAVGAASPGSGKNITEGETYIGQPELLIDSDFHRGSFGCYTLADQQERLPTILRTVHCSSEERDPPRGTTHSNTTLALNEQSYQVSEQRQGFCQDGAGIDIVVHEPPSPRGTADKVSASSDMPNVHPDNLTQLGFTQDSQENRVISHRKVTRSPAVNYSLDKGTPVGEGNTEDWPFAESAILCKQSFEAGLFGPLTSTQQTVNREKGLSERKAAVHSPRKLNSDRDKDLFTENKENVFRPTVLFSTRKEMNFNRTSLKRPLLSSGAPSLLHCSNVPHGAESLAFKRLKRPCNDQSTLSLLFSQDSQGNRVISHRQTGSRNGVVFPENWNLPLGHCTNAISGGEGCNVPLNMKLPHLDIVCKSTCMAESKYDYMFCPWTDLLFTQDSEGNAVIKHS